MKKIFLIIVLFTFSLLRAEDVSGTISTDTIWQGSINVVGDITLLNAHLTIQSGTVVTFMGDFQINAEGLITAEGTETDSIFFVADNQQWDSIKLDYNPANGEFHSFRNCRFRDADIAIKILNSPAEIRQCSFAFMGNMAIDVFGLNNNNPPDVLISECVISRCQRHGIFVVEYSNLIIEDCDISYCALDNSPRGAIQLSCQTTGSSNNPIIRNNYIHHNTWQGMTAFDITGGGQIAPTFENNIVEYNLTGIYLLHANGFYSGNQISNNFVEGNADSGAGVMISGASCNPTFTHNSIFGNFTGFYIVSGATANLGNINNASDTDDGFNQIYDNVDMNSLNHSVYSLSAQNITAQNNYWGTTDTEIIDQTINDGNDQAGVGMVDYLPIIDSSVALVGNYYDDVIINGGEVIVIGGVNIHNASLIMNNGASLRFTNSCNLIIGNGGIILNGAVNDSIRIIQDENTQSSIEIICSSEPTETTFNYANISIGRLIIYTEVSSEQANLSILNSSINLQNSSSFIEGVWNNINIDNSIFNNHYLPFNINAENCLISNNSFFNCQHSTSSFNSVNESLIENNTFINCAGYLEIANSLVENNDFYSSSYRFILSDVIFRNNRIRNSSEEYIFHLSGDSSYIVNNLITNNESEVFFDLNMSDLESVLIVNNTISNNEFDIISNVQEEGTEGIFHFYNNTFNNNDLTHFIYSNSSQNEFHFYNNNFFGSGTSVTGDATIFGLENSFNIDPVFISPSENIGISDDALTADWSLTAESGLINQGYADVTGLNLPELDLAGNPRIYQGETAVIDVGAYEYQGDVSAEGNQSNIPVDLLLGNYPNPFRNSNSNSRDGSGTLIKYQLKQDSHVNISVYNLKGQRIKNLLNGSVSKGQHNISWSGRDENNQPVASGVYFYKMDIEGRQKMVKKCLLLK
ncbi:MAG: right-handed parallel beta-helix repeat-containing protein [Candidatus Cloacimonetes bacterium]|nr:right-handed parallel beta-helix repeat-containing protein [Candidatus Cloacimonadota bacterium]